MAEPTTKPAEIETVKVTMIDLITGIQILLPCDGGYLAGHIFGIIGSTIGIVLGIIIGAVFGLTMRWATGIAIGWTLIEPSKNAIAKGVFSWLWMAAIVAWMGLSCAACYHITTLAINALALAHHTLS